MPGCLGLHLDSAEDERGGDSLPHSKGGMSECRILISMTWALRAQGGGRVRISSPRASWRTPLRAVHRFYTAGSTHPISSFALLWVYTSFIGSWADGDASGGDDDNDELFVDAFLFVLLGDAVVVMAVSTC